MEGACTVCKELCCIIHITSFKLHNNPMRKVLLLSPFPKLNQSVSSYMTTFTLYLKQFCPKKGKPVLYTVNS